MAEMYQILSSGALVAGMQRAWLAPGEPFVLTTNVSMTSAAVFDNGVWLPILQFDAPGDQLILRVPFDYLVDAAQWAGMHILPKAVRLGADGYPERILFEFLPKKQSATLPGAPSDLDIRI